MLTNEQTNVLVTRINDYTGSSWHPDQIKANLCILEEDYDSDNVDQDNPHVVWLKKASDSIVKYLHGKICQNPQRPRIPHGQQQLDTYFDAVTTIGRFRSNIKHNLFHAAWSALHTFFNEYCKRETFLKLVSGHDILLSIGLHIGSVDEHSLDKLNTQYPANPSASEEKTLPGDFMPRDVHCFYHFVIYFKHFEQSVSDKSFIPADRIRSRKRVILDELAHEIGQHIKKIGRAKSKSSILVKHYFNNDRSVVQYVNDSNVLWDNVTLRSTYGGEIEPHIHFVAYINTRKPTKFNELVNKFKKDYPGLFCSNRKVASYNLLRQYLRQGYGRQLCCENVSSGLESTDSDSGADDKTSDRRTTDNEREDDGGDVFCELAGSDGESSDGDDGPTASAGGNTDGGRFAARSGPGEALVKAILESGAPSQNELERLYRTQSWFREIQWRKTYEALLRKAFNLAQHDVASMSFVKLAKFKYDYPDGSKRLYETTDCKEGFEWLEKILYYNGIDQLQFYADVFDIMDKVRPKINTLFLKGPANAGKTLIAESIARASIFYCNIQQFQKGKNFLFMDAVGKRCCMINEPRITDEHAEVLKNVLEGAAVHVDVKFQSGQMLQRTPVVIATNHDLSMYLQHTKHINEEAYRSRMIRHELKTFSDLKDLRYALHPGIWYLAACKLKAANRVFVDSDLVSVDDAFQ